MPEITLEAKNKVQERFLAHLRETADETLAQKIAASGLTLADAERHCNERARKLPHTGGVVCVDNEEVHGWLRHFFDEAKPSTSPEAAPNDKTPEAEKPAEAEEDDEPAADPADEPGEQSEAPAAPEATAPAAEPAGMFDDLDLSEVLG